MISLPTIQFAVFTKVLHDVNVVNERCWFHFASKSHFTSEKIWSLWRPQCPALYYYPTRFMSRIVVFVESLSMTYSCKLPGSILP